MYAYINPGLIPAALLLTASVCGGSSLYAYSRPKGSLLWLRAPLMGSLIGLIAL
jgi:hypothetical protein